MQSSLPIHLELPPAVPPQRARQPQANIPQTTAEREAIRSFVRSYIEKNRPVPPLPLEELRTHSQRIVADRGLDARYLDYVAVLLNSEMWREPLASIPYDRRLLLLPKCLRDEEHCPAPFDELGLLCKRCGKCSIQELQDEAERLGYAVLVAEGSAVVMALVQTGKIDAIVGVSCLSVLERAFPYMESAAIPGVAIPLLQDDCKDTNVDIDWVWEVIHLTSADRTHRLDLDRLRAEVESWFSKESLDAILGEATSETETIAREWLARAGKRWRPFLTVCTYTALQEDPEAPLPEDLRRIAVAVECFHKASLVHDDIEDDDALRYGEETLHVTHGVPVALNVGDLLVGEGYRLIGESEAPAEVKAEMLRIAASGHRTLSLGQGAELFWMRKPEPLAPLQVLDIFRQKTAPAFEVALRLGAAYARADEELGSVLARYSEALGIAYQIRDDVEDLDRNEAPDDLESLRLSLPLAVAFDFAKRDDAILGELEPMWRSERSQETARRARAIVTELGADERCRRLLDSYKEQAVRSLAIVEHASLKGLLRRVVSKIFPVELKGWCSEFEARNVAAGEATPS